MRATTAKKEDLWIPPELYYHIIASVACKSQLATMCRVNSFFRMIAQPLLYSQVQINVFHQNTPFSRLSRLVDTLELHPNIAQRLRSPKLQFMPRDHGLSPRRAALDARWAYRYPEYYRGLNAEALLDRLFASAANLEELVLAGSSLHEYGWKKPALQWPSAVVQRPRLRSITVQADGHSVKHYPPDLESLDYFLCLVPGRLDRLYARRCEGTIDLLHYGVRLDLPEVVLEDCALSSEEILDFANSCTNLRRFKYTQAPISLGYCDASPQVVVDHLVQHTSSLTDLHLELGRFQGRDFEDWEGLRDFSEFRSLERLKVHPGDFEDLSEGVRSALRTLPRSLKTFCLAQWSDAMAMYFRAIDKAAKEGYFPNLETLEVDCYDEDDKFNFGRLCSKLSVLQLRIVKHDGSFRGDVWDYDESYRNPEAMAWMVAEGVPMGGGTPMITPVGYGYYTYFQGDNEVQE
ncbi:hypothetical protein CMUS01_09601 [Colletotrichum musicola]|uniref:Uncharacterized protein n=1 Tax=Colletotrichum musicola TaxID=2175873 RepID=A0A8H6K6M5_9PEZI|nr:hypothetical protein CMUS01_09601 [Colletotrichum musicola]